MVTSIPAVTLNAVPYEDPTSVALRDRLSAELDERYRKVREEDGHPRARTRPTPEQFDPPDGVFLMALAEDGPVGCGGLRRWGPGIGEIKRMYVAPEARGRGIGRAILDGLEEAARDRGYRSIRLETGIPQPEAIAMYEASGYRRIEPYRRDWSWKFSVALEKHFGPEPVTGEVRLHDDARLDDPEASELCRRLELEEEERYGAYDEAERELHGHGAASPSDFVPPAGLFVVARLDGRSVACGGVRSQEGTVAEIKRMYVDPPVRRRGIARMILARLEEAALESGYRSVRLETGNGQPEAMALYASAGYERIPPYGEYVGDPLSACYEKRFE